MYNLVENANVVQIYIVDSTFVLKYGCTQLQVNIGVLLLCNFVLLLRIIIFFCAENIIFLRSFSEITFAQLTRKFNLTNLIILYIIDKFNLFCLPGKTCCICSSTGWGWKWAFDLQDMSLFQIFL